MPSFDLPAIHNRFLPLGWYEYKGAFSAGHLHRQGAIRLQRLSADPALLPAFLIIIGIKIANFIIKLLVTQKSIPFMEHLAELISKLNEQFEQKAHPSKLLGLIRSIEAELMKQETATRQIRSSAAIAVVMPAFRGGVQNAREEILDKEELLEKEKIGNDNKETESSQPETDMLRFDPMKEVPTLAHQEAIREINEMIGFQDASLNDKLKEEKLEIGQRLTDAPIRDLKKAIGVNDRYVFISELFRGDEAMYERSLKTINGFRIFAEAEYWIERELKVKLGWEERKETTRHFYQLIKRRFS